ncbi:glycosyltransferase family 4 protein [Azovibrio restrictus]|uniref:glycosyltransferase family 4 protein n=1 Tax=Azovibrio restrictus TaxID=146938 RepID=UPI0026EE6FCC|nr:glycosyltransferase family 4 protein [Azovibrio restrictus]MDD3483743.1 glycosyltransferase family 4 protein [Azovibrio restrictus]
MTPPAKPVIAHLLPNYNAFPPIVPAGTELRVEQVSLRQTRYQPLVICGAFPGQPIDEQIGTMGIRRIHFSPIYRRLFQKITRLDPLPYGERMWRAIQQAGARLLHIHNEPKLLAALAHHLRATPLPVVVHIANQKPFRPQDLDLVSCFVACSQFMADWLTSTYAIEPARIQVIHTGVDVSGRPPVWALQPEQRHALRQRWGVQDDAALVFVFGGRLVEEKGVLPMLEAFELLQQQVRLPVQLLVAGNVRESQDPANEKARYGRAAVERMAGMAGVSWVGSLRPDQMHEFLLAGDVFMLPSLWDDPYPTAMLEAAAAGLPIIAGARGGITEFLQDCPHHHFVSNPGAPRELAEAMARLAAHAGHRAEAGRWLRAIIESSFDWSRVSADFEALYDRLLPTPIPAD